MKKLEFQVFAPFKRTKKITDDDIAKAKEKFFKAGGTVTTIDIRRKDDK